MGTSANNAASTPARPTGDLEYLFRQKLGEAEVAPRLQLWEQLDHDLLVQQNEAYRKRLLVHRWVAAACVLLLLSVGGWLGVQQLHPASAPALAEAMPAASPAFKAGPAPEEAVAATAAGVAAAEFGPDDNSSAAAGSASAARRLLAALQPRTGAGETAGYVAGTGMRSTSDAPALADKSLRNSGLSVPKAYTTAGGQSTGSSVASAGWELLRTRPSRPGSAAGRFAYPDSLKPALRSAPPMLAFMTPPAEREEKKSLWSGWRFGGGTAVSSFNPNINFAQASAQATTAAINNFAALDSREVQQVAYEAGAAEYRQNLRAGVGQRVALTAARPVGKHWVLLAGVEASEYRASSETSFRSVAQSQTAFAGKATAASQPAAGSFAGSNAAARAAVAYTATPQATAYRYRTVGVPVAVRYGSQKTGVSLYAKVGAAVDLLLGSRVEVANNEAATKEFSLGASDSPYRQVLATVRGGGGVQYRPAGATWAVLAGPTAEAGLTTLNRDPAQALLHRSRPYLIGVEASVEFGGRAAVVVR